MHSLRSGCHLHSWVHQIECLAYLWTVFIRLYIIWLDICGPVYYEIVLADTFANGFFRSRVKVVSPFYALALIMSSRDVHRFIIRYPSEWRLWYRQTDAENIEFMRTMFRHMTMCVLDNLFQYRHNLLMGNKRRLYVNGYHLVQVLSGIVLLCSEYWTYLVHPVQSRRHHHLLVQLWTLTEERFPLKIGDRKQGSPSFGRGCDHFWRIYLDEAVALQEYANRRESMMSDFKYCPYLGAPEVYKSGIQSRIQVCADLSGDI